MKIGKQLAIMRKERKMTQADVARLMGITPPNISYLENGTANIGIENIFKAAAAYGGDNALALKIFRAQRPDIWSILVALKKEIAVELDVA